MSKDLLLDPPLEPISARELDQRADVLEKFVAYTGIENEGTVPLSDIGLIPPKVGRDDPQCVLTEADRMLALRIALEGVSGVAAQLDEFGLFKRRAVMLLASEIIKLAATWQCWGFR